MKNKSLIMRALRSSIAIVICILTTNLFKEIGYNTTFFFMGIGALISIQEDKKEGIDFGVQRIKGSILGGILAIFAYFANILIFKDYSIPMTIGVFLVVYLSEYFKIKKGFLVACVILSAPFSIINYNPIIYVIFRIVETIIGIIIGITINHIRFKE